MTKTKSRPKPLPTPAQLDEQLAELATCFVQHARITGSPLDVLTARMLMVTEELRQRPNFKRLEALNWFANDTILEALVPLRKVRRREPPPRVLMTIAEGAGLMGWSKNKFRRWCVASGIPMTRNGNRDYISRSDIEAAAKRRLEARRETFGYRRDRSKPIRRRAIYIEGQ